MRRTLGLGTDYKGEPRFSERLIRAVATTPRLHLLDAELPSELTRTVRVLQREQFRADGVSPLLPAEASQEAEAFGVLATDEFKPSGLENLKVLVRRIVGRDAVDEAALQAIAEKFEQQEEVVHVAAHNAAKLQSERERLEDQLTDLRRQLEAEQFERAVAEGERRDAEKKTRSLERWKAERADKYTHVEEPSTAWESDPVSVSEIVERLTDSETSVTSSSTSNSPTSTRRSTARTRLTKSTPTEPTRQPFGSTSWSSGTTWWNAPSTGSTATFTCISTRTRRVGASVQRSGTRGTRATPSRATPR